MCHFKKCLHYFKIRFLREAVVIYRFLSAIKALITVISQSLLANAVLMATLEIWLDREGNRSAPLAARQLPLRGCVISALRF